MSLQTEYTLLGIESSCDDSAAAVLRGRPGSAEVLSARVAGQDALHAAYGGVVPEIAARAHAERLDLLVQEVMADTGLGWQGLDGIAVTAGPGLIGGLHAGVMLAKGLAAATGLPLIGVNHLAGHALTPRLTDAIPYPYAMLLVSGGHCLVLHVTGPEAFRRLGGTIDDAPGEAFDKAARALGLSQPGGPAIEAAAQSGDPNRFAFPRPMRGRPGCDMSFSGLKTALIRARDGCVADAGGLSRQDQADLAASFQAAIADVLVSRTAAALAELPGLSHLAVAGGVAANGLIRTRLQALCAAQGCGFVAPPLALCTDNAAMIAYAGLERFSQGKRDTLRLTARPRWPLDTDAAPLIGHGKKGPKA